MPRRPVRRVPLSAAEVLSQVLRRRGLFDELRAQRAIAIWPAVVGPALARVSEPLFLDQGTLVVRVGSPTWRMELHHLLPALLERLNQQLETPLHAIRLVARRSASRPDQTAGSDTSAADLAAGRVRNR